MRFFYCCYCNLTWNYIVLVDAGLREGRMGMISEVWDGKNHGAL